MPNSIFRIYFVADSDAAEKFIYELPEPWQAHGIEPCKVARKKLESFEQAYSAVFCAEGLGDFDSKEELEADLLKKIREAKIAFCVVEDVSKLKSEKETSQKIRRGMIKGGLIEGDQ